MFCKNCGAKLEEGSTFCQMCGASQDVAQQQQSQQTQTQQQQPQQNYAQGQSQQGQYQQAQYQQPVTPDSSSFGYAVLGFFIPLVGLILFLMWKDATPLRAKSAGKGALISVILNVVGGIILAVVIPLVLAGIASTVGDGTGYFLSMLASLI